MICKVSLCVILLFCVSIQQTNAQALIADSLFIAKEWDSAAKSFSDYMQSNPKDRPGFQLNRIGQCYFNLQEYEKAIIAFKKSVSFNGNNGIMYNIACAYNKNNQKDSALVWLERTAIAGYTQYQNTMEDEDLKSLQSDPKFKVITDKIKKNEKPCSVQPEYQQFNFWIGDWKVYNLQGKISGTSKIEQILNECVILENWADVFGNKGKSFNFYNSDSKQWQQTWVDDKGSVTEFINGRYNNGALRFQSSRQVITNGKKGIRRLTFFNVNSNEVRQLGEISFNKGKTWATEYDLKYLREK